MSKVIRLLTRTAGNRETAERVGTADIIAYAYLLLGVFIIAVPVLWTFVSSFKPDTAIESFDTRVLPYDEVMTQIEGVGEVHPRRVGLDERRAAERSELLQCHVCATRIARGRRRVREGSR